MQGKTYYFNLFILNTYDENFPCIGICCPMGGHNILEKFILWYILTNYSLIFQCRRVQGYKVTGKSGCASVFNLVLSKKVTSNLLKVLLFKSYLLFVESETANMNLFWPYIWVERENWSAPESIVFSDQIIYVFAKVLIITLMNIPQKTVTVTTEQKAPVYVRYSGSSL